MDLSLPPLTISESNPSLSVTSDLVLISPSRIREFHGCQKRYDYVYVQELEPARPAKGHFNKGNYFHELAHVYYQLIQAGMPPGSEHAISDITKRVRSDVERTVPKIQNERERGELLKVYHIIMSRLVKYIRQQSPKIDAGIEVLGVEVELLYQYSPERALFGYGDLLYRDQEGRLRIRDHKTGQKAWSKIDSRYSNQLLLYAFVVWKMFGEIPLSEINYINTKEYVKKEPTFEQAFTFNSNHYSARELEIYFEEICIFIEQMLSSYPVPNYDQHCRYCPYQTPCFTSRKGLDPTPVILQNFRREPRTKRHLKFSETFTEDDTNGHDSD